MERLSKEQLRTIGIFGAGHQQDLFGSTFDHKPPLFQRWIGSILIGMTIGGVVGCLTAGPAGIVPGMIDGGFKAACSQGMIQGANGANYHYDRATNH